MTAEKPILDLKFTYGSWDFGDISIIISWTLDDRMPCMVILPTFAPRDNQSITPCIIRMADAFRWTDTIVGDAFHQERSAGIFAANLGMDPFNHRLRARLIKLIQNRLQDLLTAPQMPETGEVAAIADLKLTNMLTGEITEIEAKADV